MEVMCLPLELADLTDVEERLLSRVVPFMKIIKLQNRFSQSWCRGQAGIVVVVETRDNLPNHKQFQVDIRKIKVALINTKYRDVRPNFANIINYDISQIIEVSESNGNEINNENNVDVNHIEVVNKQQISKFISLNNNTSILRGSFHQGSHRLGSSGRQCTAIAAVACVACYKSDPTAWTVSDLDYILIIGDKFYRQCLAAKPEPDPAEINSDYLGATELLPQITFQGSCVNLNIAHDLSINGHFSRDQEGYPNLENGIASFFDNNYTCGILTANFISVCIAYKNLSYWLIDSHARGPKGHKGRTGGVSCCLRFENSRQITALTAGIHVEYNIYSITPVFVVESGGHIRIESQHSERNLNVISSSTNLLTSNLRTENVEDFSSKSTTFLDLDFREFIKNLSGDRRLILTTSMLYDIDENIPNIDSVIESDNRNLNENRVTDIHRKTAPLIVNIERERRMEELCWYTMYPDGKNGFGKSRNISVKALDYFQARVMSNESRFQKVDYLVFAFSVVDYFRAKASVSVSCRMRQGQNELVPQGLVDNIHLTMRNIRGSASYWKRCCAELIAMGRSLGAPTWFATFSCNDLNWPDMLRALLIADGRKEFDSEALTFQERLDLVQKYPVVLARQFTLRTHRHSATCYKDRNNHSCRFGFPRPISNESKCLESDETLANQGQFCVLRRNESEVMINNYNLVLLELWQANMDKQPCGNVTTVAYYIAKYASKCEPNDCGDVVREVVQKAKRHSNDLFAVSMAILGQRIVSAPEAAYRLCHLPLKLCSRKAMFVNSCMPNQRYHTFPTPNFIFAKLVTHISFAEEYYWTCRSREQSSIASRSLLSNLISELIEDTFVVMPHSNIGQNFNKSGKTGRASEEYGDRIKYGSTDKASSKSKKNSRRNEGINNIMYRKIHPKKHTISNSNLETSKTIRITFPNEEMQKELDMAYEGAMDLLAIINEDGVDTSKMKNEDFNFKVPKGKRLSWTKNGMDKELDLAYEGAMNLLANINESAVDKNQGESASCVTDHIPSQGGAEVKGRETQQKIAIPSVLGGPNKQLESHRNLVALNPEHSRKERDLIYQGVMEVTKNINKSDVSKSQGLKRG
ncbi:hypothetical protein HW555_013881 [Spodoptera exigua]|uniref:Helitron helicase-like domain-containing protein n=1 Tax=Spodoptera exigua TaxID=7107 RepID=A0A835G4J3_SPOEX|nr:hypothetical protein HW555_013881 [Spodoptera exigua]